MEKQVKVVQMQRDSKGRFVKKVESKRAAHVRKDSKKAKTILLVTKNLDKGVARKDTIKQMMEKLNLSANGANTYYQNVKASKEGWTLTK